MKRKLLTSTLALWVLAFTSPAWSFVCSMPCKMTQRQMMDCAKSCSARKTGTSVGKGACVKLEVSARPVFTALDQMTMQAPVFALLASENGLTRNFVPGRAHGRAPLRGPPNNFLAELPTANAPPQLI